MLGQFKPPPHREGELRKIRHCHIHTGFKRMIIFLNAFLFRVEWRRRRYYHARHQRGKLVLLFPSLCIIPNFYGVCILKCPVTMGTGPMFQAVRCRLMPSDRCSGRRLSRDCFIFSQVFSRLIDQALFAPYVTRYRWQHNFLPTVCLLHMYGNSVSIPSQFRQPIAPSFEPPPFDTKENPVSKPLSLVWAPPWAP